MKKVACIAVLVFLTACGGLPKHKEMTTDNPSALEIVGAPKGAQVWVDGAILGSIEKRKARFPIIAGTHQVRVLNGSAAIYERVVFIEKGTARVININQ